MNRTYGPERAKQLRKRLAQLRAAEVLADMRRLPGARCHALRGDRKGRLSVDLDGPYRLIFAFPRTKRRLPDRTVRSIGTVLRLSC